MNSRSQGKGQSDATKEKVKEMMKEARIMKFMKHRNVVRLHGVLALEQPIGIILELVEGGALDSYLRKYDSLIEISEKIEMCRGAANGLAFIHSNRIIHRCSNFNSVFQQNIFENKRDKILEFTKSK